jgi:hypothetical protein
MRGLSPGPAPAAKGKRRGKHLGPRRWIIDRLIVNKPWVEAIVPGSYQVYQPGDPDHPDSDHLRVNVTVHV